MDKNRWLRAEDIPNIRRLDYIVKDTDPMESGYLYAALRNLESLSTYCNKKYDDNKKQARFNGRKSILIPKMEWVNEWMKTNKKEPMFTDVNDWRKVGADYDYFWLLRSKNQFVKEEAEARLGISGRTPVKLSNSEESQEFERMIEEEMRRLNGEENSNRPDGTN